MKTETKSKDEAPQLGRPEGLAETPCSGGLRWPNRAGVWTRDGDDYEVTQTADGEMWVKVDEGEYIPGLMAGLADFRERWFPNPNKELTDNG